MKIYCCDLYNRKLNSQKLGENRWDFQGERGRKESEWILPADSEHAEHVVLRSSNYAKGPTFVFNESPSCYLGAGAPKIVSQESLLQEAKTGGIVGGCGPFRP